MISPATAVECLRRCGTELFVGVPDSLLKPFGQYVMAELPRSAHIITANEGTAVAVAVGSYLRTQSPALVYLQNSGLGNTVNPLLSLADQAVYGVPMLLLVGWRGQPGVKDEPQHITQGRVMVEMLDSMGIEHVTLPTDEAAALDTLRAAHARTIELGAPVAVLVAKGTFEAYVGSADESSDDLPSREHAVETMIDLLPEDALIVSTTGMLSRELFEIRERRGESGATDFLTVGGMGHASSIALGVALSEHQREVWCFDGDGALLMHAGALATIADHGPANLYHAVFNNGVHDSVGGQPTSIGCVDVPALARASGYGYATRANSLGELQDLLAGMRSQEGPSLIELRIRPGSRSDLGRPTRTPAASMARFIEESR